jgi:hypothetical protein
MQRPIATQAKAGKGQHRWQAMVRPAHMHDLRPSAPALEYFRYLPLWARPCQRQQQAHGDGRRDNGTAAIGNEWQCHALGRQKAHCHAHIHHGLHTQYGRQPHARIAPSQSIASITAQPRTSTFLASDWPADMYLPARPTAITARGHAWFAARSFTRILPPRRQRKHSPLNTARHPQASYQYRRPPPHNRQPIAARLQNNARHWPIQDCDKLAR